MDLRRYKMETTFTMKQARKYAGYTQMEMAKKMNMDRSTYIKLENNPDRMTIERAKMFADITGISYDSIFFAK